MLILMVTKNPLGVGSQTSWTRSTSTLTARVIASTRTLISSRISLSHPHLQKIKIIRARRAASSDSDSEVEGEVEALAEAFERPTSSSSSR